jgi:large subunit ribosomal protein L30e
MDMVDEIKKTLASGKSILGAKQVIDALRAGKLERAYLSTNTEADMLADIIHYAKLSNTPVVNTGIMRDELGVVCKKPFAISVIGLLK